MNGMVLKHIFPNVDLLCQISKNRLHSSSGSAEKRYHTEEGTLQMYAQQFRDFSVYYGNIIINGKRLIPHQVEKGHLSLIFIYCGDIYIQNKLYPKQWQLGCNQQTIAYFPEGNYEFVLEGCPDVKVFEIGITLEMLKEYLPDKPVFAKFIAEVEDNKLKFMGTSSGLFNAQMQQLVQEIVFNKKEGNFRKLFLETKIWELLMTQIEYYSINENIVLQTIHQSHTDKIIKAKEIIEENTYTPCSLIDLAHMVGTNECTLKKGFKELTGSTVFNYWNDLKMKDAYDLILHTDTPIYEIAYQLGYKYPHHFTTAFKKKYAFTPAELRANTIDKKKK